MAIGRVASRHTYKAVSTTDTTLTVESGAPVHVYGMKLTAGAAMTTFTVEDGAGSETLETIKVASGTTLECSVPWLADAGVRVTTDKDASYVTVYHNNPGS